MPDKKRGGFKLDKKKRNENVQGDSWFFGIGINLYKEFPDLNNAVKDVEDIKSILVKKYNLSEEKSYLILDQQAIEENIIDRFDKLAEEVQENDKLFVYYSGHGHLNKTTNLGYWIPHDAKKDKTSRYIRNSTILDYIKVIKAKHILLISDSCFSGSLFARGGNRSTNTSIDELETIPSRWAICSGRHDEEVYDGQPGGNSPFAESIIDTLMNNQQKGLNVSKLSERIMEQTRSNYQQLPEGSPLYGVGHKGGQYVFKLKANEKESWAAALKLGTLEAYETYADNHPNGVNIDEAFEKINQFKDEAAWAEASRKNTIQAYIQYDTLFPKGNYSKETGIAIKTLEEARMWKTAEDKNTLFNYRNYIKTYPQGKYIKEAQQAMSALLATQTEKGLKEIEPITEYDKMEEKLTVSEEQKPVIQEPVAKKVTTTSPITKNPASHNTGSNDVVKKYWKHAVGALVLILAVWALSGLFGGGEGGDGRSLGGLDFTAYSDGDNILVKGFVNDDLMALPGEANPKEGASVSLKGTDNIVYTDAFGNYEISFPKGKKSYDLVFKHAGYDDLTVEVDTDDLQAIPIAIDETISDKPSSNSSQPTPGEDQQKKKAEIPASNVTTNPPPPAEAENVGLTIGAFAPNIEQNTPEGDLKSLYSLRGNYVLVYFWASWASPSRRMNSELVILYGKYQPKGFNVFAVSLDKVKGKWVEAIKTDGLTWHNVSDLKYWDSAGGKAYEVRSIPHSLLLDPKGKIMGEYRKVSELEAKLKDIYGE